MSDPHIIDAGPAINFLATKNQRILIAAINGSFQVPEAVRDEVMRKAAEKPHLAPAAQEWRKIEKNWIELLPATRTPNLDRIALALTRNPLPSVPSRAKDLGETYVVVHAFEQALAGNKVFVIIDDQGGKALTFRARKLLATQRRVRPHVGSIGLITTEIILADNPTHRVSQTSRACGASTHSCRTSPADSLLSARPTC